MTPQDIANRLKALDWSGVPVEHQLAASAAAQALAPSNVIPLPVKPRTCWTVIAQLDGRRWATGSHFGPEGAWGWIVDTVAHEHGCSEDQIGNLEGDEDQYDGDDLVTIDGLPAYRIQHTADFS